MKLRDWRTKNELTLRQMAEKLGIGGSVNPSRQMARIETGEARPDAPLADKIVLMTGGAVSILDLHEIRREWLLAQHSQPSDDIAPAERASA